MLISAGIVFLLGSAVESVKGRTVLVLCKRTYVGWWISDARWPSITVTQRARHCSLQSAERAVHTILYGAILFDMQVCDVWMSACRVRDMNLIMEIFRKRETYFLFRSFPSELCQINQVRHVCRYACIADLLESPHAVRAASVLSCLITNAMHF